MNVLIISTNAIGDTYLSASAISAVRSRDPLAKVDFVMGEHSRMLGSHLGVDGELYLPSRSPLGVMHLLQAVRAQAYDYALSFFPGLINTIILKGARARIKGGYSSFIRQIDWFRNYQLVQTNFAEKKGKSWSPEMNYIDLVAFVLDAVGFPCDSLRKPRFDSLFNVGPATVKRVTIHGKARYPNRSMGEESIRSLVHHFINKGFLVSVIGTEKDFLPLSMWAREEKNVELISNPTLPEVIRLLATSQLFLGVDSFPLHLADAHISNFFGVFGPTRPESVLLQHGKAIRFYTPFLPSIPAEVLLNKVTQSVDKMLIGENNL